MQDKYNNDYAGTVTRRKNSSTESHASKNMRNITTSNGEHRRKSAESRNVNKTFSGKRKSNTFKKRLLVYSAFLVCVIITGAILFSSYLSSYEKSRPYVTASSITKSFLSAEGLDKLLKDNEDKLDVTGEMDSVFASYESKVVGKQISYIQNSENRTDAPSFDIIADNEVVAKVCLEHEGSAGWGFQSWKIKKMNIGQYIPNMTEYMVVVPQGSTVYLDGIMLDSMHIIDSGTPQILQNVKKFLNTVPAYDTYRITSMAEPSVTAKDSTGKDITLTTSDTTLSAANTSQEFIDEVMPNTEATLECYAKHFIHESYNLNAYMLPGTPFYISIFGEDGTYGVDTSLYNYEYVSDYGFTEKNITNFVKYADNCYTVDVQYNMYVDFSDDSFSDNDQQLDATWVFVYDDDKNDWFLADCQYH
ncbi:MAG: hypothetical protein HUJ76_01970 [Parasporobacterium sp.]|nr:hypothetical protein [Parasporobacterium sp.]